MNTTKLFQDNLLPEQLVSGQTIPQDFLRILLDKLSGENKTFLVNRKGLEEKQQGPETKQNDEPSGGMDDKKDLLSLLQAWFLWDQLNTGQPPAQNDADEKGEDAGTHPAVADPLKIVLKIVEDDTGTGTESRVPFLDRTDDPVIAEDPMNVKDDTTAKDDLQDSLSDTIDGSVQMFQTVLTDKDRSLPVQDNVIVNEKKDKENVDNMPIKPVLHGQERDHLLKTTAVAEEKQMPVNENEKETESNGDYRVLFQKRDVEISNQKTRPVKALVPDEPFSITRNTVEDDGNAPLLTIKRPAAAAAHDSALEKVEAIPGDDRESTMPKNDSGLFQQGDNLKAEVLHGKDGVKVYDKTAFGSVIADRVEQVVEQYANKNSSSDMVVRLKIDGKETILVGLKDEGQKISVQIKTGSEGIMNFIQSQKDAITRSLESKNIYATIMVDINDQRGFERNNRDNGKGENNHDEEEEEFNAYLNAMA